MKNKSIICLCKERRNGKSGESGKKKGREGETEMYNVEGKEERASLRTEILPMRKRDNLLNKYIYLLGTRIANWYLHW